jgi:hypothetical protein
MIWLAMRPLRRAADGIVLPDYAARWSGSRAEFGGSPAGPSVAVLRLRGRALGGWVRFTEALYGTVVS